VHLHSWASVERAVLMDGVDVGRRAKVRNAILDKNVVVGPGVEIGIDKDDDRARGFSVSAEGVTVVGKGVEVMK
jgi:glucose-1-phosphate adenylyltransferase